jgi:hypothetical protein
MKEIKLNDKLTLSFEALENRFRLVISSKGEELACRKERTKNLLQFLTAETSHLFKGRLQLNKKDEHIAVILKNEVIGIICSSQFSNIIKD